MLCYAMLCLADFFFADKVRSEARVKPPTFPTNKRAARCFARPMASVPRYEPRGSSGPLEKALSEPLRATLGAQPEDPVRFFAATLLRGTGSTRSGSSDDSSYAAYRADALPKLEVALNRAIRCSIPPADLAAGAIPAPSLVSGRMLRQLGPNFRVSDLFT